MVWKLGIVLVLRGNSQIRRGHPLSPGDIPKIGRQVPPESSGIFGGLLYFEKICSIYSLYAKYRNGVWKYAKEQREIQGDLQTWARLRRSGLALLRSEHYFERYSLIYSVYAKYRNGVGKYAKGTEGNSRRFADCLGPCSGAGGAWTCTAQARLFSALFLLLKRMRSVFIYRLEQSGRSRRGKK